MEDDLDLRRVRVHSTWRQMVHASINKQQQQHHQKPTDEDRKPVGYFTELIDTKLTNGDFELLAPGVTRVTLPDNTEATYLHISIFHPLTGVPSEFGVEMILGLIMAAYHFNNRVDTIAPRLGQLEDCDIKLSMDIFDSMLTPTEAARKLVTEVVPRKLSANDSVASKYPTGIIGGVSSSTSEILGIMAGIQNLTQISFSSASQALENKDQYPFFTRSITPASGISSVAVDFFHQRLEASHVFIIYRRDSLGSDLFKFFEKRASQMGITTRSASISPNCVECQKEDIDTVLGLLESSRYKYVYAILKECQYESMIPIAWEQDLAGPEFFWLYPETFALPARRPGDPLLLATHGNAVIGYSQGPLFGSYDIFSAEWGAYIATNETREVFARLLPEEVREANIDYEIPPYSDYSFEVYDAFMSLGLAACDASAKEGAVFSTQTFLDSVRNLAFKGATDFLRFDNVTGSRDQASSSMRIANVLSGGPLNSAGDETMQSIDTFVYKVAEDGSGAFWTQIPNTTFIYSNNKTVHPLNIPPLVQTNSEIQTWAVVTSFLAFLTLVALAGTFLVWMQCHLNTDPIRSAQPFFVRILMFGIVLMGCSLIPMAAITSSPYPDLCCMMGPWLLSIGFCVTFASLFSRLIRINKIDSCSRRMRRITVDPKQVLVPFMILLSLNVIILIAWSIQDPLEYVLTFDGNRDEYGRYLSSTSICTSDNSWYYRVILGLLDIAALALVGYHSYRARRSNVAYNENKCILYALIASSQSFLIGIPLVAAVHDPSASLFCSTLAILAGCLSIAVPLFSPKPSQVRQWQMQRTMKLERKKERNQRANQYFATVLNQSSMPLRSTRLASSIPSSSYLNYSDQNWGQESTRSCTSNSARVRFNSSDESNLNNADRSNLNNSASNNLDNSALSGMDTSMRFGGNSVRDMTVKE